MRTITLMLTAALAASATTARAVTMPVGQKPAEVALSGDAGGRVDGSPWSSAMIKGKVFVFFYIDPSHRNDNEELKDALDKAKFPRDKYGSIAIINMAASWLPNAVIASSLKDNQEKYPDVVYAKDFDKALVKQWQMTDESFDVVVFDKQGKVLFAKDGDFAKADVAALLDTVKKHLEDPAT